MKLSSVVRFGLVLVSSTLGAIAGAYGRQVDVLVASTLGFRPVLTLLCISVVISLVVLVRGKRKKERERHLNADELRALAYDQPDLSDTHQRASAHLASCKACEWVVDEERRGNPLVMLMMRATPLRRTDAERKELLREFRR